MTRSVAPWIFGLALLGACGGNTPSSDPCLDSPPSYGRDLLPTFVEGKCLTCHSKDLVGGSRQGAPDGLDFDEYDLVMPNQAAFVDQVESGLMPPVSLVPRVETTIMERDLARQWRRCGYLP